MDTTRNAVFDECRAHAKFIVSITETMILTWCRHHFYEHEHAVIAGGFEYRTFRDD